MKFFTLFVVICFVTIELHAQRTNPDQLANRNEHLETLLLEYKEQLVAANTKVAKLTRENMQLKRKINELLRKQSKTIADINQLKKERETLLNNNKILKRTIEESKKTALLIKNGNHRMKLENKLLENANKLLEEAAIASDTILKYQEMALKSQQKSIKTLIRNYAQDCAQLTGQYKIPLSKDRITILLDESNATKSRDLESVTIDACYQLQKTNAGEKIMVYFQLYDGSKKRVLRDIVFPLKKTSSDKTISYYEGSHTISTAGKYRLKEDKDYFYEVKYLEKVIAKGLLKS